MTAMPTGGACASHSHLMTPDPSDFAAVADATEVCLSCPVFVRCHEWITTVPADQDPGGVIAGLTKQERAKQRLANARAAARAALAARACSRCHEVKALAEFSTSTHGWCKACHRGYSREWRLRRNPNARARVDVRTRTEKTCPDCRQVKSVAEFARNRAQPDGRDSVCKPCQKVRRHRRDANRRAAATAHADREAS